MGIKTSGSNSVSLSGYTPALHTFVAAALLTGGAAFAGEFSQSQVLGFTPQAKHFVFEEYGITDGLGAPYATVFAIEIATDRWVEGTPIRLQSTESETTALEQAASEATSGNATSAYEIAVQNALQQKRTMARKRVATVLNNQGNYIPSKQAYSHSPMDFSRDGKTARFARYGFQTYLTSEQDIKAWSLKLEEIPFPAGENCYGQFEKSLGYKLSLTDETTGKTKILNHDKRVPKSRGCVGGYGIEEVHIGQDRQNSTILAVLIRYTKPGFEGPDGRLLAVTAVIPR